MTTIILTRPKPSIPKAKEIYQQAGFNVFEASVFDIQTNASVKPEWLEFKTDVWVILSVNALEHALKIKPDLQPDSDTQVIAVGPAVEQAWQKQFNHPITHHPLMNSEGVIELLKTISPKSVKILTTSEGRNLIKAHCMNNSISYIQINSYVRIDIEIDTEGLSKLVADENRIVLTFTSSDILNKFMSQIPSRLLKKVLSQPIVVGAERIKKTAENLSFRKIFVAKSAATHDMAEAISNI